MARTVSLVQRLARFPHVPRARTAGLTDSRGRLARLLDRRELDARSVSGAASEKDELRAVLGGATPSPSLLCWLATVLGMHVPDMYLIVGMEIPQDLAPLDAEAGRQPPGQAVVMRQR